MAVTRRTHLAPPSRARLGLLASARCAVGVLALLRPVDAARLGGIDRGSAERGAHLAQLAGARDLALGIGLLATLLRRGSSGSWVWAAALSDGLDAVILGSATARGRLAPVTGTALTLVSAAAVAAAAPRGRPGAAVASAPGDAQPPGTVTDRHSDRQAQ